MRKPGASPGGAVLSFENGLKRRDGRRMKMLERAYRRAVDEQVRAAQRLEAVLHELEQASRQAEQSAWMLSVAARRRVGVTSFSSLMGWLGDVCKVRNAGEHFCIADLAQAADELAGRED